MIIPSYGQTLNKYMNESIVKEMLRTKREKVKGLSSRKACDDHKRRTQQGRNELCNCNSGKKFKKCCGSV